jgi:porin
MPIARSVLAIVLMAATACYGGWIRGASAESAPAETPPAGEAYGFWDRDALSGNWGGLRDTLADRGVTLGLQEQSEVWGNLSGGLNRGAVYDGLTTASVKLDLAKLAGWTGGTLFVSGYQIHGRGPTPNLVGSLQAVSGTEAARSTKLYALWIEQSLPDDRLSIRVGQEGVNDEFMISKLATVFLNSSFGFPSPLAFDLPSGGPNFPLAAPMVRVRLRPSKAFTLMAAVFDGDPAGPGTGDPQLRDRSGTAFRLHDHALAFMEMGYSAGSEGEDGLPGTYKLGVLHHAGRFNDPRLDTTGRSLADPASNGIPLQHHGDTAVYGMMDQMVWRPEGSADRGVGVFAMAMGLPGDRNLSDFFLAGGITWTGPFAGQEGDVLGLGFGVMRLSNAVRAFGADTVAFTGSGNPYRASETFVELTYQYQVAPWWMLQPDVQYIINPGAGLPSPLNGNRAVPLRNALTMGLRATVTF